ncbi:Bug family tripartite tricarboxylate transporter substrate binding protein [Muricoccus pecuniae]|uniref:Tripartite-type tricarboxylate transporter receptor subunit TctC n=1 Tax=Muricoccus pecuniae TaxID=693023 RepID=A0A840YJ41_9PROT|nr:tripartite tricarboxylate transporter substrate binding protein [Roseomonas pecuniae]MBB5694682.1 tripartite-type tricarboxylate transporter receptor subunit TctC [Roseomonas pecuniae]
MLTRRSLAAALALGAPAIARAQEGDWPNRPVNIIVPWPPGGPTDTFARLLASRLSQDTGKSFVVDNRGGASGTIGMTSAARARPDGYTFVFAPNSTYAVAPHLYQTSYSQERDFVGVGLLGSMPLFMLVPKSSPARSVADYVAVAKAPGARKVYANAGVGATSHLATEMLLQMADLQVTEIGYRGGGPAIQAVMAGEADMLFMPAAAVMSFIQSGDLRALGNTMRVRSPLAPDVPTFEELGYPGFEVVEHVALMAPAGTPTPILERMNEACARALSAPELKPRLDAIAVTPDVRPVSEWPRYLAAESAKWRDFVRARNIRVQ